MKNPGGYALLRAKQVMRMVFGIGIFHFLVLVIVVLLLVAGIVKTAMTPQYQSAVVVLGSLLLTGIHLRRRDKFFLQVHLGQPFAIYFFEYLFISLPLIIPLLITNALLHALFFLLITGAIAASKPLTVRKNINTRLQAIIPCEAFEWKAGVRKMFYPLLAAWLAGAVGAYFVAAVPLAMIALGVMVFSFYERGEPLDMLMASQKGPAALIFQKIKHLLILLGAVNLPLLLLFMVFHFALWHIPVLLFVLIVFASVYLILLKYAFYFPGARPGGSEILTALAFLAVIIPFFMPVIWLLSLRFYFKAVHNLKPFLDDFNQ
jgi:hypothetical protein